MTRIEPLLIPGPAGLLEALLEYDPRTIPSHCAVVCHPHPLFGGTMHTKAVFRAAKAAALEGIPTLRFNFRGVGKSQGTHDRGEGEQGDARAALDFLALRYPGSTVIMMGFSFGSAVGLRVGAADPRVFALVGMGLPVKSYDYSYLETSQKPKLFVEGTEDEYGPRAQVEELLARFAPPKRLEWIEGADHFFTGKLEEYQQVIRAFIREIVSQSHPLRREEQPYA
ncbi:MAG TPA: alpha/beta fold hydrolase [Terriglobia bacterium]|nr:alpha/beta fold hydrolase [Terriglobia bacterium]